MELTYLIFYIFVGWVIGFVGGMVGLVLGAIRFPFVLGIENSVAPIVAGTNLAISTLGATTGAIRHYRQKNIDFRVFVIMALSGAAGSFMGAFLVESVPLVFLLSAITTIISYEAFDLAKKSGKTRKRNYRNSDSLVPDREKDGKNDSVIPLDNAVVPNGIINPSKQITKEIAIGFGVGLLGGMVGLVLVSIRMPAMISILKLPSRIAIGTDLASSSLMGTVGVIGHLMNGNIDYIVLYAMGPPAMLGAFIGAKYTNRISESNLKFIIAVVLSLVAATMLWRVVELINLV